MKVLLLSRYGSLGASSRVRYLQYLPYFRQLGIDVEVSPLFSNAYLKVLYENGRYRSEILAGYWRRIKSLIRITHFDLVIVEKEIFPFLPAWVESFLRFKRVPYLADYDDALFHRYDNHPNFIIRKLLGKKIDAVMRNASVVVAGNKYLAERARYAGAKKVEIVPTVVNTDHYKPCGSKKNDIPIVGWIGTPKTSKYLKSLLPVFEKLKNKMSVRFVAVGAKAEEFDGTVVEVWPWYEDSEIKSIQAFDIGIMPLADTPWERGKCGYKLIQYMACGLPVVASPVGVNCEIVSSGKNGFLTNSNEDWEKTLELLLNLTPAERLKMGTTGRKKILEWYSFQVQAPRLLSIIKEAVKNNI